MRSKANSNNNSQLSFWKLVLFLTISYNHTLNLFGIKPTLLGQFTVALSTTASLGNFFEARFFPSVVSHME